MPTKGNSILQLFVTLRTVSRVGNFWHRDSSAQNSVLQSNDFTSRLTPFRPPDNRMKKNRKEFC